MMGEFETLRFEMLEWCRQMNCRKCPYLKTKFCREGKITLKKLKDWREKAPELLKDGRRHTKVIDQPAYRLRREELYNLRKSNGTCVKCGARKAEKGRVMCATCLERAKNVQKKLRERRSVRDG